MVYTFLPPCLLSGLNLNIYDMKLSNKFRFFLIASACLMALSVPNACLAANSGISNSSNKKIAERSYPSTGFVACVQNGKDVFISPTKWNQLTPAARSKYEIRGMVLKTDYDDVFVISPKDGISPGSISALRPDLLAKVPSMDETKKLLIYFESVQSHLKTLKGFMPFKGRYWIHLDNKRNPRSGYAEFHYFDAAGNLGSVGSGTQESRGIKIRDILPLYKYSYEGFDIRSLERPFQNIKYGLEIKLPDGFMYMHYSSWCLVPEEIQNSVEVTGILFKNGGNPFVIDLKDVDYGDSYMIDAKKAYKYKDDMPTKEQADDIVICISYIDDMLMDVQGKPLGGGVSKSYFTQEFIMPADNQLKDDFVQYSYGGDNMVFLENDGKINFISPDLGENNKAHVRRVWQPRPSKN